MCTKQTAVVLHNMECEHTKQPFDKHSFYTKNILNLISYFVLPPCIFLYMLDSAYPLLLIVNPQKREDVNNWDGKY